MSNRLESLNSKKPAAKPALKFKPKVVARKSKEDRDKDAAKVKTEDSPRVAPSTRGRGGARGRGRGRGAGYVGTHIVSSGPLASGSVSMGGGTSSKTGLTNDKIFGGDSNNTASALSNLKLKSRKVKSPTPFDEESDEEDDPTKINMSKEYAYEESETILFPVRPHKDAAAAEASVSPSVTVLAANSRPGTVESVKSEVSEEVAAPSGPTDPVETAEHDKILDDQAAIMDLLTSNMADLKTGESPDAVSGDDKYLMFHIPQVFSTEPTELISNSNFASDTVQNIEGEIGHLNFHKSGKISMTLGGGTVFDVTQGMESSFLQEVFVVDSHNARKVAENPDEEMAEMLDADGGKIAGNIFRLGEIAGKIIATPSLTL